MRGLISWHFGTKSHNEVRLLAYARHNVRDQPNPGDARYFWAPNTGRAGSRVDLPKVQKIG